MNKNIVLISLISIITILILTLTNETSTLNTIISSLSVLAIIILNFYNKQNEDNSLIYEEEEKDDKILDEKSDLSELVKITSLSADGEYDERISHNFEDKQIQEISNNINKTLDNFRKAIDSINDYMNNYNKNVFNIQIENNFNNDLKSMIDEINQVNVKISKMLLSSLKNNHKLSNNSDTLKDYINSLSNSVIQQSATLEETASAIEEITSTVINNNANVNKMLEYSNTLSSSINKGFENAKDSASLMDEINQKTKAIEEAITVIDQIAFQTNILSLNAAVEAATAGEAGKGFAVVAGEVRNLANRSAEAAKEIKDLVDDASNVTQKGKASSDEMIKEYSVINENIENTRKIMNDVSSSLREQQKGIEQINNAVSDLDKATQQNATRAHDTMEVANINDEMAKKMVEDTNKTEFFGRKEFNSKL